MYVSRNLQLEVSPTQIGDPDIQSLTMREKKGSKAMLINIYNERDDQGRWTVERSLYGLPLLADTILLGDFNTRHPSWDPHGKDNSLRAKELANWIDDNRF